MVMSLALGILGVAASFLMVRTRFITPEWVSVGAFTGAGLIGLLVGLIGIVRGRGLTRLAGVAGVLLNLYGILFGTLPLWFRPFG